MIYLFEIGAHNGTTETTLYLAGAGGYTTSPSDTPPNVFYEDRVKDPGNFTRALYGTGTTRGASQAGAGDCEINSASPGDGTNLDAWLDYSFNGRPIVIKALASTYAAYSSATTLFKGTIEQLVATNPIDFFSLNFHDRIADIQKPYLTARYLGTTIASAATAEGNVDLKDQIKAKIFGRVTNSPTVLVNQFDLIYQVSDSAVASIAVFDGGVPLTGDADYASIALLRAATVLPGHYATCLALGLFRVGFQPASVVTADVVQGANAAARTAAQIVRSILLSFGIASGDVPAGSFTALDALNSAEHGIRIEGETNVIDVASRLLDSVGASLAPDQLGVFYVRRLGLASGPAAVTYTESEILDNISRLAVLDDSKGIPSYRTTVRWGQTLQVQNDNEIYGYTTVARRSLISTEWRDAKVEDSAVKTLNPNAPEITIESTFAYSADAVAEATRIQALYGTRRDRYEIKIAVSEGLLAQLGAVVELRHSRLGLAAGKLFTVIGRTDEYVEDTTTLDLWG